MPNAEEPSDDVPCRTAVRFLSHKHQNVSVRLHDDQDDDRMFRYRITAAPLEAWLDTGNSLELFGIADAQHIDSDDLAQTHADRYKLLVWTETPTDVEGCVTLIDGVPLTQLCPLSSPKCPVLCLVDELQRAVWLRVDRLALRKPGGETAFDGRSLPSKRAYLQCVLVSSRVFGKYGFLLSLVAGCRATTNCCSTARTTGAKQGVPKKIEGLSAGAPGSVRRHLAAQAPT